MRELNCIETQVISGGECDTTRDLRVSLDLSANIDNAPAFGTIYGTFLKEDSMTGTELLKLLNSSNIDMNKVTVTNASIYSYKPYNYSYC